MTNKLCIFLLLILATHFAITFFQDHDSTSMLKRGDFPSFYSAAMVLRQGLADRVYDVNTLRYVQNLYWPSLKGASISYPYPPYVTVWLLPLAYFPPLLAKFLFNIAMAACLWIFYQLAKSYAPIFQQNPLCIGTWLLWFFPVSFNLFGSQNGTLSMMLYGAILVLISKKSHRADWLTGICLGLLFFKPQYAAPLWLCFLAARQTRIVLGALAVIFVDYVLAAATHGWRWPWIWLQAVRRDALIDFHFNNFNMISLAGAGSVLKLEIPALILSVAGIFWLGWRFYKRRDLLQNLEIAAPILLLASPHALFYDMGLCLLPCARYLKLDTNWEIVLLIVVTAGASLLAALRNFLPFPFLIFWVIGSLVFIVHSQNKYKELTL